MKNIIDRLLGTARTSLPTAKVDGTEVELYLDTFGRPQVLSHDFYLEVAKGNISGHSIMNKFGQNSALQTGAYEDIWDGGGTYSYPAAATASITHLYSTAADVQPIEVQGLSADGTLTVQTITLTGTTVVALTTPLWRVFRLKNMGTVNNAGVVHASVSDKATSYAQIGIGNNQTLMALYTIPLGKTGYLVQSSASLAGLQSAYYVGIKMHARPFGGVFQLKATNGVSTTGSSFTALDRPLPEKIGALTDIKMSAITSKNDGIINARFSILLIDN